MSDNFKTIVCVAVRMKSARLPRKALLPICGKPLLWHLMERVKCAKIPSEAVIATSTLSDDDELESFAGEFGYAIYRGHPDNVLSRFLGAAREHGAAHVVRVTGDNPLTDPEVMDGMIREHLAGGADYTFTGGIPRGTRSEVISVRALEKCLELAEDPDHSEYMTLYFKNHPGVFRHHEYKAPAQTQRPDYRLTVDTREDFDVVKRLITALRAGERFVRLEDFISYLDHHRDIEHTGRMPAESLPSEINCNLKENLVR